MSDISAMKIAVQVGLPMLLFAPHESELVIHGITDERISPSVDYIRYIFLPFLKRHWRIDCAVDVLKHGIEPFGQGEVILRIKPLRDRLRCISLLERGNIISFTAVIWTAPQFHPKVRSPTLPDYLRKENVSDYQASEILEHVILDQLSRTEYTCLPVKFLHNVEPSCTPCGLGILLFAETCLGHRIAVSTPVATTSINATAELVQVLHTKGNELVARLMKEIENGGVLDHNLSDQIVIFMALACTNRSHPMLKERRAECLCQDRKMCQVNQGCQVLLSYLSIHATKAMRTMEMMLGDIVFTTEKVENGIILRCESKCDTKLCREELIRQEWCDRIMKESH